MLIDGSSRIEDLHAASVKHMDKSSDIRKKVRMFNSSPILAEVTLWVTKLLTADSSLDTCPQLSNVKAPRTGCG